MLSGLSHERDQALVRSRDRFSTSAPIQGPGKTGQGTVRDYQQHGMTAKAFGHAPACIS